MRDIQISSEAERFLESLTADDVKDCILEQSPYTRNSAPILTMPIYFKHRIQGFARENRALPIPCLTFQDVAKVYSEDRPFWQELKKLDFRHEEVTVVLDTYGYYFIRDLIVRIRELQGGQPPVPPPETHQG